MLDVLLAVVLAAQAGGRPSTEVPARVDAHLDVVTAAYGDRRIRADIFVPNDRGDARPAIVVVHGGGWLKGDKAKFRALAVKLASLGYVTAAVEYRLGGEAKFPAAVHDVNAAVRFLRANASTYRVDPDRIGALGGSAGGHLVGLMAAAPHVAEFRGDGGNPGVSSRLQAAIVMAGPMELATGPVAERSRTAPDQSNSNKWLGRTVDEAPDLYRLASPFTHLDEKTPPLLFMVGEHDQPERNAATRARLKALGVPTGVKVYRDGRHGCWNRNPWFDRMTADMDVFFRRHLAPPPVVGPAKGTLVIVGGGGRAFHRTFGAFVEAAGGREARIVLVPTAASSDPDHDYSSRGLVRACRERFKVASVTVLHTHDREVADTEAFVKPLRDATGVWFGGGRQWRFVDAYAGTRTERAFRAVLDRGGAIGGSSAGATIQGSFLARGDSKTNRIMIGDHQVGFGYLRNVAIDQHVLPRKRQLDMLEILRDPDGRMNPEIDRAALLGLGIDEDAAIVVTGDVFEVIGKDDAKVLVYDPRSWKADTPDAETWITLERGERYDLEARRRLSD